MYKLTIVLFTWGVILNKPTAALHKSCSSGGHNLVSGQYGVHVPDSALTASSSYNHKYGPQRARLHLTGDVGRTKSGGWSSKPIRAGEWIQVRFAKQQRVCKVQTQGRQDYDSRTTKYTLAYSADCRTFTAYTEYGSVKVFKGNVDRNTLVTHILRHPVTALCVRLIVVEYRLRPALRFDLVGYEKECPIGFHRWKSSCYALIQERMSWMDAQSFCKFRGSHLVSVDSQAENNWLTLFLLEQVPLVQTLKYRDCPNGFLMKDQGVSCMKHCLQIPVCTGVVHRHSTNECWAKSTCTEDKLTNAKDKDLNLLTTRVDSIWISLNRMMNQQSWETLEGRKPDFFHWAHREPKGDHTERCACISPISYRWKSQKCSERHNFICEAHI